MRIDRAQAGASDVVSIDAEGSSFFIRRAYAASLGLTVPAAGDELDGEAETLLRLCAEAYEAEKRGAALCARAEQSAFNLRRKLSGKGFSNRAAALAVERLEAGGFIDDARFAAAWLRSRLRTSADSPKALLAGLQARGIDSAVAKKALREELPSEAQERSVALAIKRYGRKCKSERELALFLRKKGFDLEIIQTVLSRHEPSL